MSLSAHLEPVQVQKRNRRTAVRRKLTLGSTLAECDSEVVIHNLSSTGLLIETPADLGSDEAFEVHMPEAGATQAMVIWSTGRFFGCRFERPVPLAAISAAMLRSEIDPKADAPSVIEAQQAFASFDMPAGPDLASESRVGLEPAIAVVLLGGLTYAILTSGLATIAVIAIAMGVLFALMVATLVWTENHVLMDFGPSRKPRRAE